MNVLLNINETLELALYRALRGEVAPCVYAINADLSARPIELHVYCCGESCKEQLSEEVIESEMEQCLPNDVDKSLARINCSFHKADEFDISSGLCLIYLDYYAKTE